MWSLEVGFRGRLNPRRFPVASEDIAFRAIAVRFDACFGYDLHAPIIHGNGDRWAGDTGRRERGYSRGRPEREGVGGVFVQVEGVWLDEHRTPFFILGRSISRLFQKVEVE